MFDFWKSYEACLVFSVYFCALLAVKQTKFHAALYMFSCIHYVVHIVIHDSPAAKFHHYNNILYKLKTL